MSGSAWTRWLVILLIGLVLLWVISQTGANKERRRVEFGELMRDVDAHKVQKLEWDKRRALAFAQLEDGKTEYAQVDLDAQTLEKMRREHPEMMLVVKGAGDISWVSAVASIGLPLLFIVFLWTMLNRQMQAAGGQALSFGRSRARKFGEELEHVTFADVAGVEEAKEELAEVVEFLRTPEKFLALGAKIPKGVLLLGPPGCGKTLLARAVAGEAKVPFFFISGSDFVEMFVGVGASRVRDLFDQAKQHTPCIVFIDEIDAVGRQRGTGLGGGHDEREQTLNQLLVEMDGFDPNAGIIVMAATNRPDILDPALLRPGRFDRRIVVDQADLKGREEIFRIYLKGKPLEPDVEARALARKTPGFCGADIENLVNEAALLAARRERKRVSMAEFEAAIERVVAGPERKSRVISEEEKRAVAYHEAGHALVSKLLPHADPVQKVSIVSRGMALGYTMQLPVEDRYLHTEAQLQDRITSLMGGRAAEEMFLGEPNTGASSDIETATELARQMVTQFGMSEDLGPVAFGRKRGPIFLGRDLIEERNYSDAVARRIDEAVRRIVESAYERAADLLNAHRDVLERIVAALLERESIEAQELEQLVAGWDGGQAGVEESAAPPEKGVASG
jgi:cell division protease FtsH